jgi:multicomponent Na+:H+ antiporter subunit C
MELVLSLLVGLLYGAGVYMMLRRSLVKLLIGLALLGQATNLLIFTVGGVTRGKPALIAADAMRLVAPYADPLPQALILTAIVIGFGVQVFALVLILRSYETVQTDDLDTMRTTDT